MRSFVVTSVLLLTLVVASASAGEAQVLKPDELCSDYPDSAIATFADADLETAVRRALSVGAREDLTCRRVSGLTALSASGPGPVRAVSGSPEWPDPDYGFENLTGMQNLTGLTRLTMNNRWITDISALRGLTNLTVLNPPHQLDQRPQPVERDDEADEPLPQREPDQRHRAAPGDEGADGSPPP